MFKQLQSRLPVLWQVAFLWFRRYGWRLTFLGVFTMFLLIRDFEIRMDFNTITDELRTNLDGVGERHKAGILKSTLARPASLQTPGSAQQQDYVSRFADLAREEMKKYGIPASITLAQGLLESQAGKSKLATRNNNHFGIKCFSRTCSKGHCANFSDDHHKDFFRIYESAWESYRAHSLFLQKNRYKHLLQLPRDDYRSWAYGLKRAGYATDERYPEKLIALIENLELNAFDS